MRDIIINKIKVKPGHQVEIRIPIARLPSHTLIDLPVFVYRSVEDGPSLLLTAGIHGDEINGIEVIRRLITRKKLMPERGTVIAIPLVNIYGFINTSRTLPDGKDLNRCFPGGLTGSLARQIAHIIMTEILPNVDFGVDFHTGGSRITNIPQIRAILDDPQNTELGAAFGSPFLINSELIDKSFRKEAQRIGKSILVYEAGESLRLDKRSLVEGVNGVLRLMKYLRMRNHAISLRKPIVLANTTWVRAKFSGLFYPNVANGENVIRNEVLATITDPFGKVKKNVKSPVNGCVIGINNMPVVNSGDALINIGFNIEQNEIVIG